MVYVDTSVFVPLFIAEPASDRVQAWFKEIPTGEAAVSHWTLVEFVSAVGAKVRTRELPEARAILVLRQFQSTVDSSLQVIEPRTQDFAGAAKLMERFESGLRAGDALHLAVALGAGANALATLDAVLECACAASGLPCVKPA
ncbi:MAG: type II toxin-antitoxin system VapC family toxin [Geminicoccaceae bacterium]